MFLDPVLDARFSTADFLRGQFSTPVIHLLEPVEAIRRLAHHLANLRHATQHLRKIQQAYLVLDDLLIRIHRHSPSRAVRRQCIGKCQIKS
jgi:hypothetical protein